MTTTHALGSASGFAVYQDGSRVVVVDRRLGSVATAVFVLSLLTLLPGVVGLVFTVPPLLRGDAMPAAGPLLIWVGAVFGGLLYVALRVGKRRRARPLSAHRQVAVFDRAAGVLLDGAGRPLAPLAQVRLGSRMQLASSSPQLVAHLPAGSLTLARGNPFAGGLGNLEAALLAAVPELPRPT